MSVSREAQTAFTPNDPLFGDQWHLYNTGQRIFGYSGTSGEDANVIPAWNQGFTGNGVVIAIVDDGLQGNHPDLVTHYRPDLSYDFVDGDRDPSPASLEDSHGTAVAGVAAAQGGNGIGIAGTAPSADLAGLRFLGDVSVALISQDAYEASVLSYRQDAIDIYNNSWGPVGIGLHGPGSLTLAALEQGAKTGRKGLGNIYVFSAGNDRQMGGNVNYNGYANSRYGIAVGAIDANGVHTSYSTPGASLFVSAPSGGTPNRHPGITTTDVGGQLGYNPVFNGYHNQGDYTDLEYTNRFNGTSASAPLVSGVIALILEADANDSNGANLTWRDVQHILARSARQNDPTHPDWITNGGGFHVNHNYGFGTVDAAQAVSLAQNWVSTTEEITIMSDSILVNQTIPDNNLLGVISTFTVTEDISLEWVELTMNATHGDRGDLEVILTSPDGTESVLAEERNDPGDNYDEWQFTSARHWGESSQGVWTLRVADTDSSNIGTLDTWQINLLGSAPQNQQIDLVGSFFDVVPDTAANAGDTITVDFTIQNNGINGAGAFNVAFYLSEDGDIRTTDFLLGTRSVSGVSGIDLSPLTTTLTLPGTNNAFWVGDGPYYVGMMIDSGNAILETNENNNRNVGLIFDYDVVTVNNTTQADLSGTNFDLFPEPLSAGGNFDIDFSIQNTGSAAGAFSVSFYLSSNNTISTQDLLLGTTNLTGLNAFSTGSSTANLSLPSVNDPFWSGDGTYYVGMIIDSGNTIAESNETNNLNTGFLLDYDNVVINDTLRADLSGTNFDITPEPLNAGDRVDVDFTIQNTGVATGAFNVAFYLSSNSTISTTDTLLGTTTINSVGSFSNTGALSVNLGLPGINDSIWSGDGTYYMGMVIDSGNAVAELNESNNSNLGFLLDYDDVVINRTELLGTDDEDVLVGSPGDDSLAGLRDEDDLFGGAGDDVLSGGRGDDTLFGEAGDDTLFGDRGDDILSGGTGDDWVQGDRGDDILSGVDLSSTNLGLGEIDILTGDDSTVGNFGADVFVLGDESGTYYSDGIAGTSGLSDYARITDFDSNLDVIQLYGSAANYQLGFSPAGLPNGTAIYQATELIAIVQQTTSLTLNQSYFQYVS